MLLSKSTTSQRTEDDIWKQSLDEFDADIVFLLLDGQQQHPP